MIYPQTYSGLYFGYNLYTPYVEIDVKGKDGNWYSALFLKDSGADISICPKSFGEMLGIDVEKGTPITIYGVAGSDKVYEHSVVIKINGREFDVPMLFSTRDDTPFLLGRLGVWNRANVAFNNQAKTTNIDVFGGQESITQQTPWWLFLGAIGLLILFLLFRVV
jgi:hypothetical protein